MSADSVEMDPAALIEIADRLTYAFLSCVVPRTNELVSTARAVDGGGDLAREVERLLQLEAMVERLLRDATARAAALLTHNALEVLRMDTHHAGLLSLPAAGR